MYDAELKEKASKAKLVAWTEVEKYEHEDLRIEYHNIQEFEELAKFFKIMKDEKVCQKYE